MWARGLHYPRRLAPHAVGNLAKEKVKNITQCRAFWGPTCGQSVYTTLAAMGAEVWAMRLNELCGLGGRERRGKTSGYKNHARY